LGNFPKRLQSLRGFDNTMAKLHLSRHIAMPTLKHNFFTSTFSKIIIILRHQEKYATRRHIFKFSRSTRQPWSAGEMARQPVPGIVSHSLNDALAAMVAVFFQSLPC